MHFLSQFADDSIRELIQALAARKFFKRIFEVHIGELGDRIDYATVKAELSLERRVGKTSSLQKRLFLAVENSMRERGPGDSIAENAARERLEVVRQNSMPQIIVDFPSRGVPSEMNLPKEIGDPERKYFVMPNRTKAADNVFNVVKRLQERLATVRIFAAPDFHELIVRYLNPGMIQGCVENEFPVLHREQ